LVRFKRGKAPLGVVGRRQEEAASPRTGVRDRENVTGEVMRNVAKRNGGKKGSGRAKEGESWSYLKKLARPYRFRGLKRCGDEKKE